MLDIIPDADRMTALIGKPLYEIWNKLCALIDEHYDMDRIWGKGGKAWTYEYKYRRGGKTLDAHYTRGKIAPVLWLFSEKRNARNSNGTGKIILWKYGKFTMNPGPIMTANG